MGPFAIAMARRFPDKDIRKNAAATWMLWTCYAATVRSSVGLIRPDFGDDNAGTAGEGTYGQAFDFCPPVIQPGLVYVYDRFWGARGDKSFDAARGGTIYSILYHPGDPDARIRTSGRTGKIMGTPVIKSDGSGSVVAGISLSNVGVLNHTRRFIADFGGATGADATYVICDTSDNGVFWQMCSLEENTFTTQGNTFMVSARNGATMKGTVLYPAGDLKFATGTRPRGSRFLTHSNRFIHLQSADGSFLVVLTVVRKDRSHPSVSSGGVWGKSPDGMVKVGERVMAIKGDCVIGQQ